MRIARFLRRPRITAIFACLLIVTACGTADEDTTTTAPTSTTASTTVAPTTSPPATTATSPPPTSSVAPTTTTTTTTTTSPPPTTTVPPTTTTTTTTTTLPPPPPFIGSTKPASGDGTGFGQLTATRMAQHVNYDRFVLEFEEHVPAYDIAYANPPFIDIPGDMVGVAGNAFLGMHLHGASRVDWEASTGDEIVLTYEGPLRVTAATDNYTEAVFVTDFESDMEWILGLAERVPFRIIELDDPARLVIDVGHGETTKADVPMQLIDGEGTGFGWMAESRLAGHDSYDRFVIQFRGRYQPTDEYPEPGRPDYEIHYVAGPFGGCDSTDLIAVDGGAFIFVELRPASGIDWNVDPPRLIYTGGNRLRADTVNVTEAVLVSECEGIQWAIGVDAATTFRVTWLDNPLRLVIDVPHATTD